MNSKTIPLIIVNVAPIIRITLGIPAQTCFSRYALREKPTVEKLIKLIPRSNPITNTCINKLSFK